MAIKLKIQSLEQDLGVQELLCEQSLITCGRSKSCTVALDQAGVSRRHFIIRYNEGSYVIVDEGSTAGTMLDGTQLDPKNCYPLGSTHEITVPGFTISLVNDGKAPRQESTTVMARKLMGKILDDANEVEQIPRLTELSGQYLFIFHNDKASFVLGSLTCLDFVVAHDHTVAKEHVSFIRDISGVRLIPLMGAPTWVNQREISEPEILNHGDIITIGASKFMYQDYQDDQAIKSQLPAPALPTLSPQDAPPALLKSAKNKAELNPGLLTSVDSIFLGLFAITAAGVSWVMVKILFP